MAQANYQARLGNGKRFEFNAHVTVTNLDEYQAENSESDIERQSSQEESSSNQDQQD